MIVNEEGKEEKLRNVGFLEEKEKLKLAKLEQEQICPWVSCENPKKAPKQEPTGLMGDGDVTSGHCMDRRQVAMMVGAGNGAGAGAGARCRPVMHRWLQISCFHLQLNYETPALFNLQFYVEPMSHGFMPSRVEINGAGRADGRWGSGSVDKVRSRRGWSWALLVQLRSVGARDAARDKRRAEKLELSTQH